MKMIKKPLAALTLAIAAIGSAHADMSLLDSSMYGAIVAGGNNATVGAVNFTSTPGDFIIKSAFDVSGLGVTGGRTNSEIDVGEAISMSWAHGQVIKSFSVAVLFNGTEYNDWAEVAQVKAYNGATLIGTGLLQVDALLDDAATFTGTGFGSVSNVSLADSSNGGAWAVSNPFGNASVTRLEFTALDSSVCGYRTCGNQSDYALSSVTAVPEPQTYALLLAGLAAVGFVARRRHPIG